MTKLEEKLIELGYEKYNKYCYRKNCSLKFQIWIALKENNHNLINNSWVSVDVFNPIQEQQDINNLQQVFNEMQKDLEIIKGVLEDD